MKKGPKAEFKFPAEKDLKRIRALANDPSFLWSRVIGSNADADPIDRAKYEICQLIIVYMREHNLLQKELAQVLGIDESRTHEVLKCRFERFSLERLFELLKRIHPKVQIKFVA